MAEELRVNPLMRDTAMRTKQRHALVPLLPKLRQFNRDVVLNVEHTSPQLE
jgi:hypothetical protein